MRARGPLPAAAVLICAMAGGAPAAAAPGYAAVTPGNPLVFPRDYGSHPDFRTEWWYVTGWLSTPGGESLGFQITFFRTKPGVADANPSAFAPRQLLIAHCAISDPKRGRLWQDQRIRRAGLGLAEAALPDTNVWIDDWSLKHRAGAYDAKLAAEDFSIAVELADTQPPLLNGDAGVSRKGPAAASASYYYSLPHMKVTGNITRAGEPSRVTGEAWFDHEWSSEYLDEAAEGWDWIGINLDGGAALMAFRIRGTDGSVRWAGGTYRAGDGKIDILQPSAVHFDALRTWTSSRTGVQYPVEWRVAAGPHSYVLKPLMDDQENDTRLSTGAIYWEGAVRAYEAGRPAGRGYLELTGYGDRLKLR
ncbi:MAG TPA: lipocalin-like domain-containing protein [Steroidobacteraceae bacterium]|nr:lipocalin-like domain-containing protein [Steroidobacteraceae bacterium]